jgi:hypothetical protein
MKTNKLIGMCMLMILLASFVIADEFDDFKKEVLKERDKLFDSTVKEVKKLLADRDEEKEAEAKELIELLKQNAEEYAELGVSISRDQASAVIEAEELLENPPKGFFGKVGSGAYNVGTSKWTYIIIGVLLLSVFGILGRGRVAGLAERGYGWLHKKMPAGKLEAVEKGLRELENINQFVTRYKQLDANIIRAMRAKEVRLLAVRHELERLNKMRDWLLHSRYAGIGNVRDFTDGRDTEVVKIGKVKPSRFKEQMQLLGRINQVVLDTVNDLKTTLNNLVTNLQTALTLVQNVISEAQDELNNNPLPESSIAKRELKAKLDSLLPRYNDANVKVLGFIRRISAMTSGISNLRTVSLRTGGIVTDLSTRFDNLKTVTGRNINLFEGNVTHLNRGVEILREMFEKKEKVVHEEFTQLDRNIRGEEEEIREIVKDITEEEDNLDKLKRVSQIVKNVRDHIDSNTTGDKIDDKDVLQVVARFTRVAKGIVDEITLEEFKDKLNGKQLDHNGITFEIIVEAEDIKLKAI